MIWKRIDGQFFQENFKETIEKKPGEHSLGFFCKNFTFKRKNSDLAFKTLKNLAK
jgi:hypothetical protein